MSVFTCKMCGDTIEFEKGATVGICGSCGTKQTLPRLGNDKKADLYDTANRFRLNNDFDTAMGVYEQILSEDGSDAEAYWSLVLCRFGIEYVKDSQSHKWIPIVNRKQRTSVYQDEDYKSALLYARGYQKHIYVEEAKAIDESQKGISVIPAKEKPKKMETVRETVTVRHDNGNLPASPGRDCAASEGGKPASPVRGCAAFEDGGLASPGRDSAAFQDGKPAKAEGFFEQPPDMDAETLYENAERKSKNKVDNIVKAIQAHFDLESPKKQEEATASAMTYEEAVKELSDNKSLKKDAVRAYPELIDAFFKTGNTIMFGRYPQKADGSKAPIEWKILAKKGSRILVISDKALDCRQYNTSNTNVTWEICSLRKWLNGTFLKDAFSAEEQAQIRDTNVTADKNPEYKTNPGNATTDKVFLLSIAQAKKYFKLAEGYGFGEDLSDKGMECVPTEYALAQGAYFGDDYYAYGEAGSDWWLRSPGSCQDYAAYVSADGSVIYDGIGVSVGGGCVRPALWIKLDS